MIRSILATALLTALAATSQAQTLVGFDFDGVGEAASATATTLAAGIDSASITRGSGLTPNSYLSGNSFSARGVPGGTLTELFNDDYYFSFTVTPSSNVEMTISGVDLSAFWREGTGSWTLQSSATGFGTDASNILGTEAFQGDFTAPVSVSYNLSTPIVSAAPVEFRLYLHDYSKGENTNRYEQIGIGNADAVDGAIDLAVVGVIPEPAHTAAVLLLAVGAAVMVRRRRRS